MIEGMVGRRRSADEEEVILRSMGWGHMPTFLIGRSFAKDASYRLPENTLDTEIVAARQRHSDGPIAIGEALSGSRLELGLPDQSSPDEVAAQAAPCRRSGTAEAPHHRDRGVRLPAVTRIFAAHAAAG